MSDLPLNFWLGVEQFNQGDFYACHDTLEAIWLEAAQPEKRFYQGILQIAVALYHLENHNWRGAVMLLGEGSYRLQTYQPDYEGVAVEALTIAVSALLLELQTMGADQVTTVRLAPTAVELPPAGYRWLLRPLIYKTAT